MTEIRKGTLTGLALDRLKDLLELASEGITMQCVADKAELRAGTPLCDVSVAITDAQRWVRALLNEAY